MSTLLERMKLAIKAGLTFDGKRDMYSVFGYKQSPGYEDFYARFLRQDIAKRIVTAPPSATWRNPPTVKNTENAKFQQEWEKIVGKHRLWGQIERADRIAGIGHYSVMFLGFSDITNEERLKQPVKSEGTDLLYIQSYSEANAEIAELDKDPTSPRFGLPSLYKLTVRDPVTELAGVAKTTKNKSKIGQNELVVHHSRVIHIAENTLDNNVIGTPRLEPVFNVLDDLLKVVGGTAETYWLTANRGMQMDVDKDAELTAEDASNLADEAEEFQHQLRRIIRTRGVKINTLGSDVPDPKNTFDMLISVVSGATGIPKRILTGSEVGQLASDQDRANWADIIKERRTTYAEPNVLLPTMAALSNAGILPEFKQENIQFEWPLNFQLTPLEEAQSMAQKGRAAINLSKQLSEAKPVTTREEAREILGLAMEPEEGTIEDNDEMTDPIEGDDEIAETDEEREQDEGTNRQS